MATRKHGHSIAVKHLRSATAATADGPVLVIAPDRIGDLVLAQPLLMLLRRHAPQRAVDILASPWSLQAATFMPEVRRAVPTTRHCGPLNAENGYRLAGQLQREHYAQAIVLPDTAQSALVPFLAGIPLRTGWAGTGRQRLLNDIRGADDSGLPLLSDRYAVLASRPGIAPEELPRPRLQLPHDAAAAVVERLQLHTKRPLLAMFPMAGIRDRSEARRWPESHYAAVAETWIERGGEVWLLGSVWDRQLAQLVGAALKPELRSHCRNLAGRTALAEAIALIALCDHVISSDSGPMHLAAALQKPQIALFGPSSSRSNPPLNPRARVLSLELPCSPCLQSHCPLEHRDCLNKLSPARVLEFLSPPGEMPRS